MPPTTLLRNLIQRLKEAEAYDHQPVVVLVVEYDAPITEHLGTDADPTPVVNELWRFCRVLKDDEGHLYGVFVTGIHRFARYHPFSAANNFIDISDDLTYGALCGFTEGEVDRYFAPYRDALADREPRLHDRDIQANWYLHYNGDRLSPLPKAPQGGQRWELGRSSAPPLSSLPGHAHRMHPLLGMSVVSTCRTPSRVPSTAPVSRQ